MRLTYAELAETVAPTGSLPLSPSVRVEHTTVAGRDVIAFRVGTLRFMHLDPTSIYLTFPAGMSHEQFRATVPHVNRVLLGANIFLKVGTRKRRRWLLTDPLGEQLASRWDGQALARQERLARPLLDPVRQAMFRQAPDGWQLLLYNMTPPPEWGRNWNTPNI